MYKTTLTVAVMAMVCCGCLGIHVERDVTISTDQAPGGQGSKAERVVGGISESESRPSDDARLVRNDVAQPGREINTLRYFRIKKGTFPDFHRASREGVWPYFEKIGSRVVGMWKVIHPEEAGGPQDTPDYDEVYLMTRYASVEHWAATRSMSELGGNGPDWQKCMDALKFRRGLTLETQVIFLEGDMAPGGPYFMPGYIE